MNAALHIQTQFNAGKTILQKAYSTTPFKVANITEDKKEGKLKLMLMSSSPGILDGDVYEMKIDICERGDLELQTQSFQRLFTMKTGASQSLVVQMQAGSTFIYLPHPVVPHQGSDFVTRNKIHLSDRCTLLVGEVLTCGRKLSGERFKFTKYHNVTEIFLNNRLVIKENLLLRPLVVDVNAIGQLEGFTHQASLIYVNETTNETTLVQELNRLLNEYEEIEFGVSALPVNGVIVRMLGYKGEQLHLIHKKVADYILLINNKVTVTKASVYAS